MGYHAALQGPFEEPVCLLAKAKCWKGSQVSWHQNRQEAYCLGLSFVFCDSLIPYVSGLQLRFLTDSRTALSWMRGGEKMTSRSIERIAISRLCEAVADLKEAWVRRFGVHPIVEHISAAQNADADTLSRFASAWKIPPAVVFDGRFSDPKSRGRFPPTVLAPEDATDDSDMEAMATLLLIISEERVYYIPENLDAAIGRPARLELLALQERSSESRELVSKIRGAGNSDVPVSTKRGDFICTEDGILLRRSRPIAESRGAPARLCFYIPSDLPEAVDYAKKLLQTYHIESGSPTTGGTTLFSMGDVP
ncbi:hypothetical protein FOL47_003645 [Perkinsus chesapeaki]|uniref:Uncharacterized protein n=1 Tax=Perkinsus chesapeaki TaxID=330153 RepID=A0A7J6KLL0_PERCH|nr:hypothetical protein FOL47_003645 [Perkinsus chesapeaki]